MNYNRVKDDDGSEEGTLYSKDRPRLTISDSYTENLKIHRPSSYVNHEDVRGDYE